MDQTLIAAEEMIYEAANPSVYSNFVLRNLGSCKTTFGIVVRKPPHVRGLTRRKNGVTTNDERSIRGIWCPLCFGFCSAYDQGARGI